MAVERTLSIVKPDGVGKNLIGEVYRRFENAGLRIVAARMMHLTAAQAEGFYAVHRERPFFKDLCAYMTSGPVMVQVLRGRGRRGASPRDHGRDRPEEGRPRHDPPTSPRASRRTWCTAPTAPRTRRARSGSSSPNRRSARARAEAARPR
jgi:nucleoside-diphosphate kinase